MKIVNFVIQFLFTHGVGNPNEKPQREDKAMSEASESLKQIQEVINLEDEDEAMTMNSEENDEVPEEIGVEYTRPDQTKSSVDFGRDETIEPWQFGEVVDLDFLRVRAIYSDQANKFDDDDDDDLLIDGRTILDQDGTQQSNELKPPPSNLDRDRKSEDDKLDQCNESVDDGRKGDAKSSGTVLESRLRKRRKIDKYSQDERWLPNKEVIDRDEKNDSDWDDEPIDNVEDDESWNEDGGQHESKDERTEVVQGEEEGILC